MEKDWARWFWAVGVFFFFLRQVGPREPKKVDKGENTNRKKWMRREKREETGKGRDDSRQKRRRFGVSYMQAVRRCILWILTFLHT